MKNKNLLLIILLVVAVAAIWYLRHIVVFIIIAAILSLIGQPIDRFYTRVIRFGKFRISATVSAALAFLTLFLGFFLLTVFFVPLVMEEAKIISSMNRETLLLSMQQPIENIERILKNFNIDMEGGNIQQYLQDKLVSLLTLANLSVFFNNLVGALGNFFMSVFAISFFTFFFLRDENIVIAALFSIVPEKYSEKAKDVWTNAEHMLKRYFIGILIEVLLVITFLSAGLWIAGIKHALLIALFAGLVNVIPYVGPLIGTAFALFIGVTTNPEASMLAVAGKILIVFISVQIADAFFLQPMIYSSSVKAHPLEIFLVILIGATLGGIGGMILAVPSYTIIRVIAKGFFTNFRIVKRLTKNLDE
ncbi:MAG TPA: AI-2E family transporter [Bacteroidia bacterium]